MPDGTVLVEENHQAKRGVIHDAMHGTKANNRIKCRDNVRSPSAREETIFACIFSTAQGISFQLGWRHRQGAQALSS